MAIYERRDGWAVRVYAGLDSVTGVEDADERQGNGSHARTDRPQQDRHRDRRGSTSPAAHPAAHIDLGQTR